MFFFYIFLNKGGQGAGPEFLTNPKSVFVGLKKSTFS